MRRLAWFTSIIWGTLAVLFLLWEFRSAVWIFLFSLAAAATFRPPIKQLTERGLSLSIALLLVYGSLVLVVGGLLIVVSFNLLTELQDLANQFAIGYEHMVVVWPEGTLLQQAITARLPTSDTLYDSIIGENSLSTLPSVLEISTNVAENLTYLIVILFLGIYWTVDQVRFERLLLSLIPAENRAPAREMWRQIETNVGSYLRSELVQSLLAGLLLGLGYWLIGLQYPTLLALIGAVVWLIPLMGVLLALIPVIILGVISGLWVGLTAGLYTMLVFWLLEYVIEPRFFDRRRFSSLLLVLVMLALVDAFGLAGLLLAPPLAVTIQITFTWLIQKRIPAMTGKTIPELVDLQDRVSTIETKLAANGAEPSPRVVSMLERLKKLLNEAADTPVASASE
ncbi:MAG: AI-2E family transporter [Anaerolineaceae bacterium]|nr:AI-2E family transporter [Anaerolineaceae bacterium]MCB9101891.1 AI-2E family transporter [Anaerolineales bacterium]